MPERFRCGLNVCINDMALALLSVLAIGLFNALLLLTQWELRRYFNC